MLFEFVNCLYKFVINGNEDWLERDMISEQLIVVIGNCLLFYSVKNEEMLWVELYGLFLKDGKYGFGVVLIFEKELCCLCGNVLVVKFMKVVNVIVYYEGCGIFMGCCVLKVCCNKYCKMIQYCGYYIVEDNKFYDEDWEK